MGSKNVIAALVLLALAVGYGFMTAHLPARGIPNTPGPSFFPWIITAALAVLSVALLVQGLRTARRGDVLVAWGAPARRALAALAAFAVYLAALPYLGFAAASVPFFAVLMLLYGERRPALVAAGAVALPLLIFLLFRFVFQIPLPRGVLPILGG